MSDAPRIIHSHTVPSDVGPVRFSDYCEAVFAYIPSRKGIRKAIKRGALRLDGELSETGTWLRPGQVITHVEIELTPPKVFPMELEVLFEDDFLAVVHKPAGIVVSGNKYKTVQNALQANLSPSQAPDALPWPRPVHRLDRGTSGLLLIAKSQGARIDLGMQLERKVVEKRYRAVVIGLPPASGQIDTPIEGKASLSEFSLIRSVPSLRNGHLSLLDLFPRTGRTHQLRIHLASLGHPILGDREHGTEGLILKGKGMFLSAVELAFRHPKSGERIAIETDQPGKFERFMEGERKRWEKYRGGEGQT